LAQVAAVKVVLHAGAVADLTSAGDWYESQRPGLGLELRDEIAHAFDAIAASPTRWPVWPGAKDEAVRRFLLPRFPFAVAYSIKGNVIGILAIAHTKRRGDYWRRRSPSRK
jgi:toxin ParE1/3/4